MKQMFDPRIKQFRTLLGRFRRDEEGGIIIFALVVLVAMLVVAGMGVDFMRFESQRTQLQSVSDRAVLAAAELEQTLDEKAVVNDFFAKAGLADAIIGEPVVNNTGNSRTVRVDSQIDVNTFYLRLIGIDQLTAPAASAAVEGIGKVEISLVLDISGSMRWASSTTPEADGGKFKDMQDAAVAFADKVLDPNNGGQVSLTIVPYAGHTNPGPHMFSYLNGVSYGTTASDGTPFPNESSCIEFTAADWATSGLPGTGRPQVPLFMNWAIAADVMDWGWCPHDRSAIRYAMNDADEAETFIRGIRMHDGTGTHYAMKWGLAALDPTAQPAFEHLSQIDVDGDSIAGDLLPVEFSDRPAAWNDPETRKIIVLMTDGAITTQFRPHDPLAARNANRTLSGSGKFPLTTEDANEDTFDDICEMAKSSSRDVEVFTVAFEVGGDGRQQMEDCASDASMFFPASGSGLIDVFEDIAEQITDLRLSL